MKKLLLATMLMLLSFVGNSQELLGMTTPELKNYYWKQGIYPSFSYAVVSDGDSCVTMDMTSYTTDAYVDAETHKVSLYYIIPKSDAYTIACFKILKQEFRQLSENKWTNPDFTCIVEYRWFSTRKKYGFSVKKY